MNRRNFVQIAPLVAASSAVGATSNTAKLGSVGQAKETFVLVHGAWHGGWCWQYVADILRAQNHLVHTPTLTGLASRKHLLNSQVGLQTHIDDITNHIVYYGLEEIVLVGHSYAGMVVTGIADTMPGKIKRIIYLDAVVPNDQESMASAGLSGDKQRIEQSEAGVLSLSKDNGLTMDVLPANLFGVPLTDEQNIKWLEKRLTPHPLKTWTDEISLSNPPAHGLDRTFIHCTKPVLSPSAIPWFAEKTKTDKTWKYLELKTGHDAMVTMPRELADILTSS